MGIHIIAYSLSKAGVFFGLPGEYPADLRLACAKRICNVFLRQPKEFCLLGGKQAFGNGSGCSHA